MKKRHRQRKVDAVAQVNQSPVANSLSKEKVDHSRRSHAALWFVFLLSSGLIITAARGDLWLDEIWSLSFVRDSHSVTDIFVRFHHDNNHALNTLFLYFMGEQKTLFLYRLFAVLSGIASVFLVGFMAKKEWGYSEALCSIVLTGTSYPLLLYFSEARGYAPAILFALVSYAVLRQNMLCFKPGRLAVFWATSILGILSHSTFIMVTFAFAIWTLAHEMYADRSIGSKALRFIAHHIPPFVFFAWWYIFFLRDMVIGGGPLYGTWAVIGQASALLLGFPEAPGFLGAAIICILILVALGAKSLRRERDSQWIFYPAVLFLSPALLLMVTHPKYLFFRYFIIAFPFFYLLLSYVACKYYRSWPKHWRWVIISAIAILIAGQIPRDYRLLKLGRGNYSSALAHIVDSSPNEIVRVASDHDFRNRRLFDFYAPRIAGGNNLRYVEQSKWIDEPPDWILTHSQDVSFQPPEEFVQAGIGVYRLTDEYRYSGVSGWNWFLFRRKT